MPRRRLSYTYDANLDRYRDSLTGKFLPQSRIDSLLNRQMLASQKQMQALSQQLIEQKIDLQAWREAMREQLRTLHSVNAAIAQGGLERMGLAEWARVGGQLRFQYSQLDRFSSQIQYGAQPLDGRFKARVNMYARAGHATYEETKRAGAKDKGFTSERRVMSVAEHCADCLEYAARGWQPIGTLPKIGDSVCQVNCRCKFEYATREK